MRAMQWRGFLHWNVSWQDPLEDMQEAHTTFTLDAKADLKAGGTHGEQVALQSLHMAGVWIRHPWERKCFPPHPH